MQATCMDGQCVKKLSIGEFKWAKKPPIYTEEAIKMYDENNDYGAIPLQENK